MTLAAAAQSRPLWRPMHSSSDRTRQADEWYMYRYTPRSSNIPSC
eukprot:CAMPEP_0170176830 /NCGR_PEP_ID=MMETSP0040_2-20121228/9613_1 /TAXON_ID=641309 /ORGANISM="Lotharella oceanica, Strain CCMP622" /LENGTH=44 /DNA_ID= /DNA_START= /DNA_END= /DNA_ORIENTATION=